VIGAGAGKSTRAVRWGIASEIGLAWLLTLPVAAGLGAAAYGLTAIFGSGVLGPALILAVVAGLSALLVWHAAHHSPLVSGPRVAVGAEEG
jgi:PiT family inorganic phosphate transporter